MFENLKLNLLSVFRGIFVYHHYSLEYRAKLFAAMIVADENAPDSIYEEVASIGEEIYGKDEERIGVLVRTTKEYVNRINSDPSLCLDQLIIDIDQLTKNYRRYVKKINIDQLRRLQSKTDENVALTQQRIIEFAESEIRNYGTIKGKSSSK